MGHERHLMDILNEVSARLDHAPARSVASTMSGQCGALDELQAFILIDPLLGGLHKEYLDARAMRAQTQREYGAADGMTDLAVMMEDSAWCAMQTRLMELRADRALRAKANAMIEESRKEEEEREAAEKKREALRLIDQMLTFTRMREMQEEKTKDHGGWFLFLMLMMNAKGELDIFGNRYAAHHFNLMAA